MSKENTMGAEIDARFGTIALTLSILPLIIVIEGFVSIAVEILAIRQLLPVAGGSVIVTSLIIGIFLLFLALGYRQGGRKEKHLQKTLRNNFFIAACWLGVGLSYIFVAGFFHLIQKILGFYIIYPLIIYLFVIIAPLIYILGQTIPITMNMAKQNKAVGTISGDTLGMSTIGSFLGATVTSLIFMQYFGVAWTIFLNVALLLMLFLLLIQRKQTLFIAFYFASAALWFVYTLNVHIDKNLFVLTNNYANYQIFDEKSLNLKSGEKIFSINNSFSSFTNHKKESFLYNEIIKKILFTDLALHHKDILVLGAGGFTLSAQGTFDNHITYVDIDPDLTKAVQPQFLEKMNGDFVVDDARHFVQANKQVFQAIVVDTFSSIRSIPSYLVSYQFMRDLKTRLADDGTVIFNIVGNPRFSDAYSKRIDNTIRMIFKNCMVQPTNYRNQVTNILYVCANNASQKDFTIYTDNLNTSTTDSFEW